MKYKYLVTNGCSQTQGQNCHIDLIWPRLLADRLGLELINLATPSAGWYNIETTTMSFINNNKDIINQCFFILQKSMLDRRAHYEELALNRTDIWEKWNIEFLTPTSISYYGATDFAKFGYNNYKHPDELDVVNQTYGLYDLDEKFYLKNSLIFFPEHRHYPNSRNPWKFDDNIPPYIYGQFEELMLHWATRVHSFHLLLNNIGADHLIVDGYSPFLSYKLNFRNYYDTDDEFEMVKRFWSVEETEFDEDDVMLYDFKNIKAGWLFDSIDIKNKIDDVILWSLYQFKTPDTEWNIDGGHAGPKGMKLIESVIYQNLQEKGWFV